MRAAPIVIALGSALLIVATPAQAVGFGRIVNATQLGQPLNFAAAIRLEADESLPRECVSAEVFSGDNKLQQGQVRVTLEGNAESNERTVRITTNALIEEPVVTVNVTVGCTSKVTRRFVAFIDPPIINLAQAASTENSSLPPPQVDSQVVPIVAVVQGNATPVGTPARKERAPRTAAARPATRPVAVAPARQVATAPVAPALRKPSPRVVAVRPAASAGTARLELEAAPTVVARAASAAVTAVATPAAAITSANAMPSTQTASAAPADAQAQQLERERERIAVLEQGLAKLRVDAQATQQSVAVLQARLREAESERYANPLVYALAWLSALLAAAVGVLWWRQTRASHASQWWAATGAAEAARRGADSQTAMAKPPAVAPESTMADTFDVSTVDDEPPLPVPVRTLPLSLAPVAPVVPAIPEPTRELSVEELIDLEQQAEFFIVLGQDEAAIDLLMSHVRGSGGISPLPYLKLLKIYRRRGDRDAYERIRERFNRRFNAYAPDWDSDLQQGRSLVDYPDIIERLQSLWVTPPRAMETLDASLFRRNQSDDTFDLPAYRELLFLYSIARDLAEHGATDPRADVDVLLPLNVVADAEPIARLMATTQNGDFQNSDMMKTVTLDLDVSFDGRAPRAGDGADAPRVDVDSGFLDLDEARRKEKPGSASNR